MKIWEMSKKIHKNAIDKGFWEGKERQNIAEKIMLVVTELAEAVEAHRSYKFACPAVYNLKDKEAEGKKVEDKIRNGIFEKYMKDTFEDELADAIIRILDLAEFLNIDIEYHITEKHKYNLRREHLHGKRY